jgi:hypothetical protein
MANHKRNRNRRSKQRNLQMEQLDDRRMLATFNVTNPFDEIDILPGDGQCATASGPCSLRAAIQEANALPTADTIVLAADTYELTIAGQGEDAADSGDLDVTDTQLTTVIGQGLNSTFIDAVGLDRVFQILGSGNLQLRDLTITGGNLSGDSGAGINNSGKLTLDSVHITGNSASSTRGTGGGIMNRGSAKVIDSTISDNYAEGGGAGIGGSYGNDLEIIGSTISNNNSDCTGGGLYSYGPTTIVNSTTSGNRADEHGGGLMLGGNNGTLHTIVSSTIVDNIADGAERYGLGAESSPM